MSSPTPYLTAAERTRIEQLKIKSWLGGRFRKRHRERCFTTLDTNIARLRAHDPGAPISPDLLVELLLPYLRADRTIAGYFDGRGVTLTDEVFAEIHHLTAKAVVARYIRDRNPSGVFGRGIVATDDLRSELDELLHAAVEAGTLSEEEGAAANELRYDRENVDDLVESARRRIEQILGEELDLAAEPQDGDVPPNEQQEEIARAALRKLRVTDLQNIAAQRGLGDIGDTETLVDQIARQLDYDEAAVAELVLSLEERTIDYGLISRLIPLRGPPNLNQLGGRLETARGKYVRIRSKPVHWFIFEEASPTGNGLLVTGRLKGMAVQPVDLGEEYRINATPREAEVRVRLRERDRWAELNTRRVGDMRAVAEVLYRTGGADPAEAIPLPDPPTELPHGNWDLITLWFLNYLQRQFNSDNLQIANLTMAHFEAADAAQDSTTAPQVRSVRLRGQYLDAHREACQLMVEGRRLLEVELQVWYRVGNGDRNLLDVRLSVSPDHISVATGSGRRPSGITRSLHDLLLNQMREAVPRQLHRDSLVPLLERVVRRARQPEPAAQADMLYEGPAPETERSAAAAHREAS
jgi:hypothetical protein